MAVLLLIAGVAAGNEHQRGRLHELARLRAYEQSVELERLSGLWLAAAQSLETSLDDMAMEGVVTTINSSADIWSAGVGSEEIDDSTADDAREAVASELARHLELSSENLVNTLQAAAAMQGLFAPAQAGTLSESRPPEPTPSPQLSRTAAGSGVGTAADSTTGAKEDIDMCAGLEARDFNDRLLQIHDLVRSRWWLDGSSVANHLNEFDAPILSLHNFNSATGALSWQTRKDIYIVQLFSPGSPACASFARPFGELGARLLAKHGVDRVGIGRVNCGGGDPNALANTQGGSDICEQFKEHPRHELKQPRILLFRQGKPEPLSIHKPDFRSGSSFASAVEDRAAAELAKIDSAAGGGGKQQRRVRARKTLPLCAREPAGCVGQSGSG